MADAHEVNNGILPISKQCLSSHGHYETEVNIRRY